MSNNIPEWIAEMSITDTVQPLPEDMRDPMRRTLNKGLMVRWINADLMSRAGHDVRKSIVLYDESGVFETALTQAEWDALGDKRETFLSALYAATRANDSLTPISYYSKGIK